LAVKQLIEEWCSGYYNKKTALTLAKDRLNILRAL
ncbi:unnamed protein product, partial [marine sediment metagenome]